MTEKEKTLIYTAKGAARESSQVVLFKTFSIPVIAAIAGSLVNTMACYLGGAVGLGYSIYSWRKRKEVGGAELEVENRTLFVRLDGPRGEETRIPLDDLLNVSLDSKSFTPVQEGSAMIPATRFIDQKAGDEIEESRIVLTSRDRPDLALSEGRGSYSEAIEWLGKIRSFLRKHGWVPDDERE